jgi:hypothetical protein
VIPLRASSARPQGHRYPTGHRRAHDPGDCDTVRSSTESHFSGAPPHSEVSGRISRSFNEHLVTNKAARSVIGILGNYTLNIWMFSDNVL